jgi:EmrB/QacA subfamily drug resistance transporter
MTSTATMPDTTPADTEPYRWRWQVLAVVLAANVLDILDSTIVNVAGPSIRRDLGGGATTLQWLSAGFTLALAMLLVTGARLGDIFGRRRLFLIGVGGFTLMSAACAAAPTAGALIALRVLQGASGALLIPQGFGLIKQSFPEEEMGKVFGFFGPATGLPLLVAPVLAGALIDWNLFGTGWRLVFLINVPVGAFAFLGAVRVLPRTVPRPGVRLDLGGVALVGTGLAAIIYPLIQGRAAGWPAWSFIMLGTGLALLAGFAVYERHMRGDPLIEQGLLSNRTYLGGIAVVLAFFGAFGGLLLCISLFGQLGEGWSPIHAGLALTPMVVGMIAGMAASFALVARLGRHLMHIGIVIVTAGAVVLALTVTHSASIGTWALVPSLFAVGLGAGMSFGQLFDFILAGVGDSEVGSASGVLEAVQQLSSALGVAVLGTIFFSRLGAHLPTDALQITAWACLAPLAAAFGLVFLLPMQARAEH